MTTITGKVVRLEKDNPLRDFGYAWSVEWSNGRTSYRATRKECEREVALSRPTQEGTER